MKESGRSSSARRSSPRCCRRPAAWRSSATSTAASRPSTCAAGKICGRRGWRRRCRDSRSRSRWAARQYIAVTTGLGGGSPRHVPSTLAPEIQRPDDRPRALRVRVAGEEVGHADSPRFDSRSPLAALPGARPRRVARNRVRCLSSLALPDATITAAADGRRRRVHAAAGGGRGGGHSSSDLPGVLPCRGDAQATADSDIKVEVWLPAGPRVERQVPGGRQRRMERQHRHERAGRRPAARLRHREHRHRSSGRRRAVDGRPGEADRLRLPRGARDDRERQGDRGGVLRQRAATLYFRAAPPAGARGSSPRRASPRTSTASSPARPHSTPRGARYSRCTSRRACTRTRRLHSRRRSTRRSITPCSKRAMRRTA